MIVEACLGGLGRHVVELSLQLAKLGHRVHVLYCPGRMDAVFETFLANASSNGIDATKLEMRRNVGVRDVNLVRNARSWIKRNGPWDVVHGHSSKGGAIARIAGRRLGAVTVYTPNAMVTMDPKLGSRKRRIFGLIERRLGRLGDALIAVSEEERDHAIFLGVPKAKVVMIPNGISVPKFADRATARRALGLTEDEFCVGYVGRMVSQKAPEVLVRAFAEAFEKEPSAKLALVGSGELTDLAQQTARDLGVFDRTIFLGEFDARAVFLGFDVFALSSRYEGHPFVLVEALFAGLPVVATRVSGVTCMVEDGVNGLLTPRDDVHAFAVAVRRIFEDSQFRTRAGKAGLARSSEYSIEAMTDRTLAEYRRLLAGKRALRRKL